MNPVHLLVPGHEVALATPVVVVSVEVLVEVLLGGRRVRANVAAEHLDRSGGGVSASSHRLPVLSRHVLVLPSSSVDARHWRGGGGGGGGQALVADGLELLKGVIVGLWARI